VPCFPSGKGIETFFRLGADGYRDDLGNRSMGREPRSWRISVESDWISEQGLPALNRIQSNKSFYLSIGRPRTVSTRIVIAGWEAYARVGKIIKLLEE